MRAAERTDEPAWRWTRFWGNKALIGEEHFNLAPEVSASASFNYIWVLFTKIGCWNSTHIWVSFTGTHRFTPEFGTKSTPWTDLNYRLLLGVSIHTSISTGHRIFKSWTYLYSFSCSNLNGFSWGFELESPLRGLFVPHILHSRSYSFTIPGYDSTGGSSSVHTKIKPPVASSISCLIGIRSNCCRWS